MTPAYEHIPGRYGVTITRTETGTAARIPLRDDLADETGALRLAAVLMAIDMGAGLAAGSAVLPNWTVTADIETRIVGACTVGPLRVHCTPIKPGRTMSVVECRIVDEGAGDALVALSTANHGVLEPTFDDSLHHMSTGGVRVFAEPAEPDESLEAYFGLRHHEGGVELAITDRTRNPWGILHGGLTGMMMETTARAGGVRPPDRPDGAVPPRRERRAGGDPHRRDRRPGDRSAGQDRDGRRGNRQGRGDRVDRGLVTIRSASRAVAVSMISL